MLPGCWETSLGHPGKRPLPPSAETQRAPQTAKCLLCPTCPSLTKALLFALLQATPGNPPSMTARQWVHWSARSPARYFHLRLNPPGFVSSLVNQGTSLHASIISFCVLCSSSTDCFGSLYEYQRVQCCCVFHTHERGRKCSLFHCRRRNTSFQQWSEDTAVRNADSCLQGGQWTWKSGALKRDVERPKVLGLLKLNEYWIISF